MIESTTNLRKKVTASPGSRPTMSHLCVTLNPTLPAFSVPKGCSTVRFRTRIIFQIDQVEFVDQDVDYAHRIGIADVVVEALGK
ncbi:hypothetical protein D3C75_1232560 [compost metagenome]